MKNAKNSRIGLIFISLLLVFATALNAVGCAAKIQAESLTESIAPNEISVPADKSSPNYEGVTRTFSSKDAAVTDFAVRLFKASEQSGKNTLISPLSVICALAMTANGAEGETLKQMENVLGMTADELNYYLYSYINNLPNGDKYKLSLANSVWFSDSTVNNEFLQTIVDYYGADAFEASFNRQTCKDINNWVKQKTDGMITDILDKIPDNAIMYLVNALAFEAEWIERYEKRDIEEGTFTKEDGTKQKAKFMYGSESIYLEDEKAIGFMKHYSGRKYAFVAMLPNEGVSVSDYVASLDGESLNALLKKPAHESVSTAIPEFETEFDIDMRDILSQMGMPRAFDRKSAEFERISKPLDGCTYIDRVIHKTFISVSENGTKAGAATVLEIANDCCDEIGEKKVYLNRPFVYMLIDCEKNIPFFIGTMNDIEK